MKTQRSLVLCLALAIGLPFSDRLCLAADIATSSVAPHTIRTSGEATLTATPDRAEITLSITTTAGKAEAAGAKNAEITTEVLRAVRAALESHGTCKTAGYSLNPDYDYSNGAKPRLTGYDAVNSLQVELNDLSLTGKVIDAALQSGATTIGSIAFTLKDQTAVRREALAEAATRARSDAEAIAKALDLHITGVLDVQTNGDVPILPRPRPLAMAKMVPAAATTPVDPGTLDIRASVTLTVQVQ